MANLDQRFSHYMEAVSDLRDEDLTGAITAVASLIDNTGCSMFVRSLIRGAFLDLADEAHVRSIDIAALEYLFRQDAPKGQ